MSGIRNIEGLEEEIFHRVLHPRALLDIIERTRWALADILRIFKIAGSGSRRWSRHVEDELFQRILHDRAPGEWFSRRPELVIRLVRLAEELGGEWSVRFEEEILDRFWRYLDTDVFVDRSPQAAIKLLVLTRRRGGRRIWPDIGQDIVDRLIRGRLHPVEIGRANPELAAELIELAFESGRREWAERFGEEMLGDRYWAEGLISCAAQYIGFCENTALCAAN